MSVTIMGEVWKRAIETVPKMILLKLADHANDAGASICPGNKSLRLAAGLADDSTVKRRLKEFRVLGILVEDGETKVGRGYRKSWRLDLQALRRHFPPVQDGVAPPNLKKLAQAVEHHGGCDDEDAGDSEDSAGIGKTGAEEPPSGDEEGGAENTEKGGSEQPKEGLHGPPEPSGTVEPSGARARDGDPEGPSHGDALGKDDEAAPDTSLAAVWRELEPAIVEAIGRQSSFDHNFADAFVTERQEIMFQPTSPDGKHKFGEPRPVVLLKLAVAHPDAVWRANQAWRHKILKATGCLLSAKLDKRAMGARRRREERENEEAERRRLEDKRAKRRSA